MTPITRNVLVVDRGDELVSRIRGGVDQRWTGTDVVAVPDGDSATRALDERPFNLVVANLDQGSTDVFELALGAVGSRPRIDQLVLVGRGNARVKLRSFLGGRIRFVDEVSDPFCLDDFAEAANAEPEPLWVRFEHLEILDLVRIAALSGSNVAIRLRCLEGDGVLAFGDGALVHASTAELVGGDAFFQMVLWRCGPVEKLAPEKRGRYAPNIVRPIADLMEEAARFRELLVDKEPDEAVQDEDDDVVVKMPVPAWRERLARRRGGVQVVIACPDECEGSCCRRLAEHLASELDATPPDLPKPTGRPAFVRIHPSDGGQVNLTLIPRISRHRFLFETLAAGADAVVVCDHFAAESDGWWERIPVGIPKVASESKNPADWGVIELLQGLPEVAPR